MAPMHGRSGWIVPVLVAGAACGQDASPSPAEQGDAKRAAGDLDGAIAAYSKALQRDARDVSAYVGRGRAKSAKRDFPGAIADYSAAISLAPLDPTPRYHRGVAKAATGDHAAAIADFTAAIAAYPRHAGALAARSISRRATDDLDGAVVDASAAVEIDAQSADARLARAEAKHAKGELDAALADYAAAIERRPRDAEAWAGRGAARSAKGDLQGAVADLTKAAELDPRSCYARACRGLVKKDLGDLDGALADCVAAVDIDPTDAPARIARGDALAATGDVERALDDYARAAETSATSARARGRLGRLRLAWLGPSAVALADLQAGADGFPAERDSLRLWICFARIGLGEGPKAAEDLLAQVAARPAAAADDWYGKVASFLAGRLPEADLLRLAASDDKRRNDEQTCETTFYAGAVRALRGERGRAVDLFDRCLATGVRPFVEFDGAAAWRTVVVAGARVAVPPVARSEGGAGLSEVQPDGPAARAGLQAGDVVTAVDGKPTSPVLWRRTMRTAALGTALKLVVARGEKTFDVELKLAGRD